MKKCPYCHEEIQSEAIKCRYCGEWFEKKNELTSNKDISNDKLETPQESHQQITSIITHESNNPEIIKDEEKRPTKKSRLKNALTWLGIILVFSLAHGFAKVIVKNHKQTSILGDVILVTLVYWAWVRGWKWWALLPPAISFGLAFIWSIGAAAAGGAEIEKAENFALVLVLICWAVLGIMIILKRKPSSKDSKTSASEDIAIEKIIRDTEIKTYEKVKSDSTSEPTNKDEEFMALIKSTVKENRFNVIPDNDLIEIYNRAKLYVAMCGDTTV